MRTIITMHGANGKMYQFSFETSPLLNQEEQIQKVIKREGLEDYKLLNFEYFDAIELKGANIEK